MFILDTDTLSIFQRARGREYEILASRVRAMVDPDIRMTIITAEEQMRGWLSVLAKAKSTNETIHAYGRLEVFVDNYRRIEIVPFTDRAAVEFMLLHKSNRRAGTMDL